MLSSGESSLSSRVLINYELPTIKETYTRLLTSCLASDLRERLCLEIERLGLSVVIMGSRGFGAEKRGSDGKLGSVSDYRVHHCVCPVIVVRYPDDRDGGTREACCCCCF
ncbi:unnamed protein product [Eruca vesicaria subsp. sativa]|uniref:UspA domain-containing protein n=1 Tax=Eruca vesicaria subsp. sativa TaxID=29727 RepID=A0ABC8LT52_ERUVS|nr:unnamed protein product [Eruca vesicaria subsp. sativa]